MPQGKAYQEYLENTENKVELMNRFTKYIHQDHIRSKLRGNVTFNCRKVTYRINSREFKTLFTSNHEEAKTKIVYYCISFNKPWEKAKDTDII